MVGHTLAHYQIVEQIGAGGMGVVYRAHDTRLGREVALKVLPAGTIVDQLARRRLRNEARLLSRLNHPNIATIHDFDTADGIDFLVMELVPGLTLSDALASGPMPPSRVAALGAQLADGVAAAHQAGIIHSDLKPTNVRVTPDGLVKVLDFGIARRLPSQTATTETDPVAGGRAGTLQYMAPEQLRGAEPAEPSDIYATGAVLYEMATGRPAFSERPEGALVEAILHREPEPPSTVNRAVPLPLDVVILKALDKDPARRYLSEKELAVDLRRVASGAHAPSPRRRWSALVPVGIGLVAVLALAGASLFLPGRDPAPRPDAGGRVRLAILEPRNLTGHATLDGWPAVAQTLLVGELTGVEKLGVMDPQSLDTLLTTSRHEASRVTVHRALLGASVSLVLDGEVVPEGEAYALRARLVDPATGESRFSTASAIASEAGLVAASRTIAEAVLMYLQFETRAGDEDVRPWIRSRSANLEAVKAFLQANADIYKANSGEQPHLRRAIALDPDFIAPRVWLAITLNAQGQSAEALAQYEHLTTLMGGASPFERAMVEFTGARLDRDAARQERALIAGLQYSPGNNILLFQLAGLQVQGKRCGEAMQTMAPAIAMRWRYRNLYPLWGWCAIQAGRAADAAPALRDAAEFDAPSPRTFAILEAIALWEGDARGAAAYRARYEATHQRAGVTASIAPLFTQLGREGLARGPAADALPLFRRAAEMDFDAAGVHDDLGVALRAAGDAREAEAAFRRAAALDATLAHPHLALGELCEAGGRAAEAVGHYRAFVALEKDPAKATPVRERIAQLSPRE